MQWGAPRIRSRDHDGTVEHHGVYEDRDAADARPDRHRSMALPAGHQIWHPCMTRPVGRRDNGRWPTMAELMVAIIIADLGAHVVNQWSRRFDNPRYSVAWLPGHLLWR
jgi:hypothetical protein